MRTTKKQLEAKVAWLQRDVDDYYSRSKEWGRYADVMEALLRVGEHHRSYRTLRTLADELRAAAEKPTTSSDIIATQLGAVAPLMREFWEKEDTLVSRFKPRDLRIPIPMNPGGRFTMEPPKTTDMPKTTTMAQVVANLKKRRKAARKRRKIAQSKPRPDTPPNTPRSGPS